MVLDIYNKEQVFYNDFEYYCFKSCYINILRYYGVKNPEFYIEYSMDWTFLRDSNEKWGYTFQTRDAYFNLLHPYNQKLQYANKKTLSVEDIWESNKKNLQNDIPVVVSADVFHLKYTPYFHKKHSIHSLILSGYDKEEEKVYVIDWYPPWFHKGELLLKELDIARNSANESDGILSGVPINYESSIIVRSEFNKFGLELIKQSIQDNLDKYYHGECGTEWYKGYYAINEIAKLLECNMNLVKEERVEFMEDLYQKLYFVGPRKKICYWFLGRAHEEYPMISVDCVQEKLNVTINSWMNLLSLIIKCSMKNTDSVYEKVLCTMQQILIEEKQFYYSLYELSNNIKLG